MKPSPIKLNSSKYLYKRNQIYGKNIVKECSNKEDIEIEIQKLKQLLQTPIKKNCIGFHLLTNSNSSYYKDIFFNKASSNHKTDIMEWKEKCIQYAISNIYYRKHMIIYELIYK
tara:strand:+ start:110 stop:451 length:342 start_codon:yes stop_codon:yes gene_type:complete